jgi:magnesium transporter
MTFILSPRGLATIRYTEPKPVATYAARLLRQPEICATGEEVIVGLMEAFVDRIADVLEKVSVDLDDVSQMIFDERYGGARRDRQRQLRPQRDLQAVLKTLGRNEDITSTVRESLLSLTRLIHFVSPTLDAAVKRGVKDMKPRIKTVRGDIASLNEHAGFESTKVNIKLDATLGMINIEQSRIIKIFSIAAVAFLPPTLVASIYGMNFHFMPELDWIFGYPMAIVLMIISALLPLLYFRRKGWL